MASSEPAVSVRVCAIEIKESEAGRLQAPDEDLGKTREKLVAELAVGVALPA
jgi:hypothetical protein